MKQTAKDIMTTSVITVRPSTTIGELARILIAHRISGAPVVSDAGELAGIVTENDLIAQNKRVNIPTVIRLFDAYIVLDSRSRIEREIRKMAGVTVDDICTKKVITVTEDAPIEEIATIMDEKKVHLIPVVRGRSLVGIIGKIDLIRGIQRAANGNE